MAWQEAGSIYLRDDTPQAAIVVFINTATNACQFAGVAQQIPAPNVWVLIDVTLLGIPADAKSVHVRETLIITSGSSSSIPDLATAWKSPSFNAPTPLSVYADQAISIGPTGGARTNASDWAPVVNGQIHFGWLRGEIGDGTWPSAPVPDYPTGAAYGINATIDAFAR